MFIQGRLQQVCTKSCPADQELKSDGSCGSIVPDPNYQEPMCPAPCSDAFLGDCSIDFDGMCDDEFVQDYCQKTCNLCPGPIPCSKIPMRDGSSAQAPKVPGPQYALTGVLPRNVGESVYLDSADIVAVQNIQNPDGVSTPIQVTGIQISPHNYRHHGNYEVAPDEFEVVQRQDGRWKITRILPPGAGISQRDAAQGNALSDSFDVHITVSNGQGENSKSSSWSMPLAP